MTEEAVYNKILALIRESSERDARIETSINYMEKRMDGFEQVLKEMSDILSEQKHLSSVVDQLSVSFTGLSGRVGRMEKTIWEIQHAPAKNTHDALKKIIWMIVPMAVTFAVGGIILALKNYFGGQ